MALSIDQSSLKQRISGWSIDSAILLKEVFLFSLLEKFYLINELILL